MCLGQKKIADNIYEICFEKPKELKLKPGQFMMLKVDEKQCFLRRPFSFSEITEESFSIIYRLSVRTQAMTKCGKVTSMKRSYHWAMVFQYIFFEKISPSYLLQEGLVMLL